ncbi:DUF6113 family protein [Spirillospora sp. NPDC029432]|uniref:DUF6113 family protein n=1 Tax=Spirillospora sp. NPDC029432 TaxID=3154599 RepID=UPI0034533597
MTYDHEPEGLTGAPEEAAEGPLDAFVSGAAYAALGLLGAIVGVLGSFAHPWTAGSVPVAGIALILLNFGMVRLAGWAMGGRIGAAVPALLWTAVAVALSARRGEGDLIVPGTTTGYLFIIGGLVAVVIGVSLVPARRPPGEWLTGGPFARG